MNILALETTDRVASVALLTDGGLLEKRIVSPLRHEETVMPAVDELRLEEPKIAKQSGGYGVKLRAAARSIHMIRANIETEINPVVGTEQQSEDLVKYLLREFEADPKSIWGSNLFGKSLYELVNEGLRNKLDHIPEASRKKLSETLERIVNEGSNGLICILL